MSSFIEIHKKHDTGTIYTDKHWKQTHTHILLIPIFPTNLHLVAPGTIKQVLVSLGRLLPAHPEDTDTGEYTDSFSLFTPYTHSLSSIHQTLSKRSVDGWKNGSRNNGRLA